MKQKFLDEIKEMFVQAKVWLECETEYLKLTASEKFTILLSSLIMGAICLMLGIFALALMSMALVDLLAFLSVAGIVLLIALLVVLLRKQLLYNPIARFITRLFLDKK